MKTVTIHGGVKLSEISLGAGNRGVAPDEDVFRVMDLYVERGGFTFDSARIYASGNADTSLGKWLRSRGGREKFTVITKGSHPMGGMFVSRLSPSEIEEDLDASLAAIGSDFADLHMLHRDDVRIPAGEIMETLDSLVKKGKARAVGVSNWTATRIIRANAYAAERGLTPLSCSQTHHGLALTTGHTVGDPTYIPMNATEEGWYRETGFPLLAFGGQARGWFSAIAAGGIPKESAARNYSLLPENYHRLERLVKLSRDTGQSVSAILTAYVRDGGLNVSVLCAYSSPAQLEDSFGALEFTLTPEQIRFLEGR